MQNVYCELIRNGSCSCFELAWTPLESRPRCLLPRSVLAVRVCACGAAVLHNCVDVEAGVVQHVSCKFWTMYSGS